MSMRRYLLVRAAWQLAVLFGFISLAYVVAFVVPKAPFGHDPGYGGFLQELARGSLGTSAAPAPGSAAAPSVRSYVWDASWVTLSFLLMTGVFAVALGALFAFAMVRGPRRRSLVRGIGMILVSLLPLWTGLYLALYFGADWHVVHLGYCPLRASSEYECHGLGPWLASLLLPAIALSIYFAAIYGRWLAAAFRKGAEQYRRDVEDGRDSSEAKRAARRRHGLAFLRQLSRDFAFAIGFGAFLEAVFGLPGLGRTVIVAAHGDAPLLAGALVAASVLAAGVTFLVDVACAARDRSFRCF
jgi:peptide/nickel transport system permease protein